MKKIEFNLIKGFGPSILKVKIPNDIVNSLNSYIDNIVENKSKSKELNHGEKLVGDVTQEFKLEEQIMKESGWGIFLANCVSTWIDLELKKKISKFQLVNSWIVRQFENEYNPTHWHGGHISGAGFLKVPETLGKHVQEKQNREYRGGNLQLIHGSRMFLCHSTMNIVPKVGDFYFFPNYLMHTVFPFKNTKDERRSISFNAYIDNDIYNVYGKA
jgi:hypothetical protein